MVARWAEWATGIVEAWPDDPGQATFDVAEQDEAVRLAEITQTIGQPTTTAQTPRVFNDRDGASLAP
jgi:hypothetical protein